jgi:hypothetical protein
VEPLYLFLRNSGRKTAAHFAGIALTQPPLAQILGSKKGG